MIDKGRAIKSDLVSRPNARNWKYRACQLDQLNPEYVLHIKSNDIFFLESLQMKANLADKMISEAEMQGEDTTDLNFMKGLGERINAIGTPIHKSEAVMTASFVSLKLIALSAIAIGIWSLIFEESFLIFCFYGAISGFLISVLIVIPVLVVKRTREGLRDTASGAEQLLGGLGLIIGTIGLIVWIAKLIL